jgi:hypothetical protein
MREHKHITLYREDLAYPYSIKPIQEIFYCSFQEDVISLREIREADLVVFVDDDGTVLIIKDRYKGREFLNL